MSRPPSLIARAVATGFGSGCAPALPGTFGSAAATLLWLALLQLGLGAPRFLACGLLGLALLMGTPAIAAVLKDSKSKDPSSVVIDEWAGMFLIFALLPVTAPASAALLFVFFRLFDIVKPGPVRWAERLPGAYGVMADDLVAGLMAALLFFALQYWQLPWW